ncbi:MAG: DMT family transporter [Alphaproteobacteria bacterium]|nr:DMT family transporter [Alphaproteobacteria bacterium]
MFTRLSPVYKGILLSLFGYSVFSIADIGLKWLSYRYSIFQIIAFENGVAVILLLCFAPLLGGTAGLFGRNNLKIHGMRIILNFGLSLLLTYCYRRFPLADVYTMLFTKPFFAAMLALWYYHERAHWSRWLVILTGFCGVVIAMRPGSADFDPFLILPLGAACLIALMFICTRSLEKPGVFSLAFPPMLGAAVLTFPLMLAGFKMPEAAHIPVFLVTGICSGIGLMSVSLAYRTAAASVVAPFVYVQMIWALVFGWIIFGDAPDIMMLLGAGIIIASGIYLVETERRAHIVGESNV